jgi:hypothetical protein
MKASNMMRKRSLPSEVMIRAALINGAHSVARHL